MRWHREPVPRASEERDMTSKQQAPRKPALFRAADHAQVKDQSQSHPLNPNSLVRGISLSEQVGLQRVGFHLLRIPPGKESFVFHTHHSEEEFMYVLSGRGLAEVGDESFEVGPGDFLGFPTPSVGHHLRNPFQEDLVYISGGERREVEVADFPRLGKRLVRFGSQAAVYELEGALKLSFDEE
jgi:uncharacterized cupin superfamily protein